MSTPQEPPRKRRTPAAIVMVVVLVLLGAGVGLWWWLRSPAEKPLSPEAPSPSAAVVQAPIENQPPIVVDDLGTPSETQALMEQRKSQLGLETGVDMVVRGDETIQIGDIRIPMAEILEKIRIKAGEIVEDELVGTPQTQGQGRELTPDSAKQRLRQFETRAGEIERLLADPQIQGNPALAGSLEKERDNLKQTARTLKQYLETTAELEALVSRIAGSDGADVSHLAEARDTLRQTRAELEAAIKADPYWDGVVDAYGIYVVREGDNIWNIHFQFLRNYFNRRGIVLESTSDEPTSRGVSSGVGRILKFSENMVNIYNVRQRRLEMDLDLIHPLSKIVIFNLEQVFSLLKQIDDHNVQRIEYDGETLWIPADQSATPPGDPTGSESN